MKKNVRNKKIISAVIIVLVSFSLGYGITYFIDMHRRNSGVADVSVVFDDTDGYTLTNIDVLSREESLKEWPYMFTVNNDGTKGSLYQILISDDLENDIKRDCLDYILMLGQDEVKSGHLNDLQDNVLYEGIIPKKSKQRYKLYIYKNVKSDGLIYSYRLTLKAILEGGPGFNHKG